MGGQELSDQTSATLGGVLPDAQHTPCVDLSVEQGPQNSSPALNPEQAIAIARRLANSIFLGRHQIVGKEVFMQQSIYALLVGGNQLLFGSSGEGKTQLARQVLAAVEGATVFRTQLTKMDPENVLFGALNVSQFVEGRYRYNTENTLIDSDLAFLDEIFDANDPTLRAALGVLNEGEFSKAGVVLSSSLHSCIAATNHRRETASTEAVLSRFHFQAEIPRLTSSLDLVRAHETYQGNHGKIKHPSNDHRISMNELRAVKKFIKSVGNIEIPSHVAFLRTELIKEWEKLSSEQQVSHKKARVDTREHVHTDDVMMASALLRGKSCVELRDLEALQYTVPVVGTKEQQEFAALSGKFIHLLSRHDLAVVDKLIEIDRAVRRVSLAHQLGERLEPTIIQRIMINIGLSSEGIITFKKFTQEAGKLHGTNPLVIAFKGEVLRGIERERAILDVGEERNLLEV